MNKSSRPVMRYPSGKWKAAGWIIDHFPRHEVYVEVFGGAASVLMQKEPSRTEIYNDIDSRIVNIFRVLRDPIQAEELKRLLELTPFATKEYEDCYGQPENAIDDARMMIARSFFGIGSDSIFRRNGFRRGFKNHKLDSNNAFSSYTECLPYFVNRLRDVIIENFDWRKLIKVYDSKDTLFYVDPPYLEEVCSSNSVTYEYRISREEHLELSEVLRSSQGNVVLSGYQCELYDDLYKGWFSAAHTAIAGSGRRRTEMIWIKQQEAKLF